MMQKMHVHKKKLKSSRLQMKLRNQWKEWQKGNERMNALRVITSQYGLKRAPRLGRR